MRNIEFNLNHVKGLFFEMVNDDGYNDTYNVQFIDRSNNEIIYESEMKNNTWVRLNRKYLSDIVIKINLKYEVVAEISVLDFIRGKKVFISFDSSALGDTLAWMPICEAFRIEYNCELVVSTFKNDLLESQYPEIKFVGRGVSVNYIVAMFELGWFYDKDKEPIHPATISLQKAAKNILFVRDEQELICNVSYIKQVRPIYEQYICISTQSTAQLKLWDYWQELINWLKEQGYKVVEISKDPTDLIGLEPMEDKSLQSTMNYLYHCEYFIGLSSGLSWLAWALRKKVYMISNFSEENHEFTTNCVRITNKQVCHGCWNNPKFKFNKGDWDYCPEHEDTPRQFECHKMITISDVIKVIGDSQPKNIF